MCCSIQFWSDEVCFETANSHHLFPLQFTKADDRLLITKFVWGKRSLQKEKGKIQRTFFSIKQIAFFRFGWKYLLYLVNVKHAFITISYLSCYLGQCWGTWCSFILSCKRNSTYIYNIFVCMSWWIKCSYG